MKKSIMKRWVKALRSGKYKKGTGQLRSGNRFCCLGVLCELSTLPYEHFEEGLPRDVIAWAGMRTDCGKILGLPRDLTGYNDGTECRMKSFNAIANLIEKNWEQL